MRKLNGKSNKNLKNTKATHNHHTGPNTDRNHNNDWKPNGTAHITTPPHHHQGPISTGAPPIPTSSILTNINPPPTIIKNDYYYGLIDSRYAADGISLRVLFYYMK
jgi:hypothetical protein